MQAVARITTVRRHVRQAWFALMESEVAAGLCAAASKGTDFAISQPLVLSMRSGTAR